MMDFLNFFHFIRPWWLLAAVPSLVLVVLLWLNQKNSRQWQHFISPHLLPFLLDTVQLKKRRWPLLGLAALWAICIVALAGPAWQKVPQPVEQEVSALVICWDLSPSMLAEDVKPSRLVRSRLKIIDLLQSHREGQVALIAYSGEAYTVTPLTDDTQTIINLLPALTPTTLPTVGSNPEMALEQAQQLLKDAGAIRGNILFITDDIDPAAFDYIENELRSSRHQLSIWAVGTKEGAPIPLPGGGFAKSANGMVIAKLDADTLTEFASKIGAYYIPMQTLDGDISSIIRLLDSRLENQTKKTERVFDQWFEHGQYLALVLLPFVAFFFRRGWIFGLFFCVALPMTPTQKAYALGWQDLWQTQDQQAQDQLEHGNKEAAKEFSTPDRRGAALFKQEQFEASAKEFAQADSAAAHYNRGNALTHAGKYQEAIKAFDKALATDPEFVKASDNRDIAQQLAELEKKQQQKGDNSDQQQQKDGDKSDDKQQNKSQSQDQEGDDSQSQKGQQGDQSQEQKSEQQKQDSNERQESDDKNSEQNSEQTKDGKESEKQKPEDNPYSKENIEAQKPEKDKGDDPKDKQQLVQPKEDDKSDESTNNERAKAVAEAMQMSDEEKEEKQKLEQWLRRVPDDPSGLMRNKFKYEYNQRRQGLQTTAPYSNDDPEERW